MKKIIGLTGPSGAGKSTVSALFSALGAYTVDADRVARSVVERGKPALLEIRQAFGEQVMLPDKTLNRRALANIVFHSPEALHKLNGITHKYIAEEIKQKIDTAKAPVAVIDAAVLFESGMDRFCDCVVCVTAPRAVRLERIMARDGLSLAEAQSRIDAQHDDDYYICRSDFHMENDGETSALAAQAEQIIRGVCSE